MTYILPWEAVSDGKRYKTNNSPPQHFQHQDSSLHIPCFTNSSVTSNMAQLVDTHLREYQGRGWNRLSSVYQLPADAEEMDVRYDDLSNDDWSHKPSQRLSLQHRIVCLTMGGPCPVPVTELDHILKPRAGTGPRILDIGCGSGIWYVISWCFRVCVLIFTY